MFICLLEIISDREQYSLVDEINGDPVHKRKFWKNI